MTMFRAILYTQWKWSRVIVLLGTIAAFAIPVLSLQGAARADRGALAATDLLQAVQSWGVLYPLLAATLGLLVAITAWAPDHRGRHVHALTLPLPRWRYVVLRFAAGGLLLGAPLAAVALGAAGATMLATIPAGLQAYPMALVIRFGLALLVAYAMFFAVSAGTARTAGIVLGCLATVVVLQLVAEIASVDLDLFAVVQWLLMQGPGPLTVFTGRWMLVDV